MQPTVEAVDQKEEKIPMGVCTLPNDVSRSVAVGGSSRDGFFFGKKKRVMMIPPLNLTLCVG